MRSRISLVAAALFFLPTIAWAQDPTALGPYPVATAQYNHGNAAFSCPAGNPHCTVPHAEVLAEVYYPAAGAGPFPLVIFLHGISSTCYDPTGKSFPGTWNPDGSGCSAGVPLPSYRGYSYIGEVLASHGYIVASISANGITAAEHFTIGELGARAYLIEEHLRIWDGFNHFGSTSDPQPFASGFIGKVDMSRIGTAGHSRGGDGVAMHYALFNGASPYHVRAVFPIASTNSGEQLPDVNLGVLTGYCDDQLLSMDGLLYFDRARYLDPADESTKYTFLSLGSNHLYFNTVWTAGCWPALLPDGSAGPSPCWSDNRGVNLYVLPDDGETILGPFCNTADPANHRLTPEQQRKVAIAYVAGFFRAHLGGEKALLPFLRGDVPAPAPILASELYSAYLPGASSRRDVNRFDVASSLTQTTLVGDGGSHGTVTANSLETCNRCGWDVPDACFPGATREAHLSSSIGGGMQDGLSRVRISWNSPADSLVNTLPDGTHDVRDYDTLQFRVGVDYTDLRSPATTAFSVVLKDATNSATVSTDAQLGNNDLYFPPSDSSHATPVMNTLRIPLSAFTGINLADVRSVTFLYDRVAGGTILVSDLAFVKDERAVTGCEASQNFIVDSQAIVTTPDGAPAVNSIGTGQTVIGSSAQVDGIISVGPVGISSLARVRGDVLSQSAVTTQGGAVITGSITQNRSVSLPRLPTLPAFPTASGNSITVNPPSTTSLPAGSYRYTTVNSGGTLVLGTGDYFFTDLIINASATVRVAANTRVYVQNTSALRSSFTSSAGAVVPITFGYAGTADLHVETRFDGILIAPQAHVYFGIGGGLTYTGSFYARILEVNPSTTLVCTGSNAACTDQTKNGDETDVDCGGAVCGACPNGKACVSSHDCSSGNCSQGVCQPSTALQVVLSVYADWAAGYCATIQVKNLSSVATSNWSASINLQTDNLANSWNGSFAGSSGVIAVVPSYNADRVIAPGATDSSLGFCVNRAASGTGTHATVAGSSASY
jgi:hypothetical protein